VRCTTLCKSSRETSECFAACAHRPRYIYIYIYICIYIYMYIYIYICIYIERETPPVFTRSHAGGVYCTIFVQTYCFSVRCIMRCKSLRETSEFSAACVRRQRCHIYIYIYKHMYLCIYICVHICICIVLWVNPMYIYIYICIYIYIYIYIYVCVCVCVSIYVSIYVYVYVYNPCGIHTPKRGGCILLNSRAIILL